MLNPEKQSSSEAYPSLTDVRNFESSSSEIPNFAGYLSAKARSGCLPAPSAVRAAPTTPRPSLIHRVVGPWEWAGTTDRKGLLRLPRTLH